MFFEVYLFFYSFTLYSANGGVDRGNLVHDTYDNHFPSNLRDIVI